MTTPWLVAGALFILGLLVGQFLFWVIRDSRERREWALRRKQMADAAIAWHKARQDAGRYLTDDPRRPE